MLRHIVKNGPQLRRRILVQTTRDREFDGPMNKDPVHAFVEQTLFITKRLPSYFADVIRTQH